MDECLPVLVVGLRRPEQVAVDLGDSFTARRMEFLLGVRRGALLRAVDACNLLGPHDEMTRPRLRQAADLVDVSKCEVLVLLGVEVAQAFGFHDLPTLADEQPGEELYVRGCRALLLPHPSGRNRTWNNAAVLRAAAVRLQAHVSHLIPERYLRETAEQARRHAAIALRSREWQPAFLDALSRTGVKAVAAAHARVSRDCYVKAIARNPEFARMVDEALDTAADRFEAEAVRRAIQGSKRPIFQGGVQVGEETVYSDNVLLRLLSAVRPEKWSERRRMAMTGPKDDEPVQVSVTEEVARWRALSEDERREELSRILAHHQALVGAGSGPVIAVAPEPAVPAAPAAPAVPAEQDAAPGGQGAETGDQDAEE